MGWATFWAIFSQTKPGHPLFSSMHTSSGHATVVVRSETKLIQAVAPMYPRGGHFFMQTQSKKFQCGMREWLAILLNCVLISLV
jgi:hypothetical protein